MTASRRVRMTMLLLLGAIAMFSLAACEGVGTSVRVGGGYYGGYYGPGAYWGRGGGIYMDGPIIVGPPIDDTPIAVPLPSYDYDIWND